MQLQRLGVFPGAGGNARPLPANELRLMLRHSESTICWSMNWPKIVGPPSAWMHSRPRSVSSWTTCVALISH
ncbi:hypothetical protein [Arthrobacter sp. JCM 19049]|uniref:hypothetical protein n=1 Tax=Arthrobacter sp. JCM 19049 TaxID=1460643 RepID=UPI0006CF652C|nr:hypothetical protein [Arthrobacter sp. JCM 19049]